MRAILLAIRIRGLRASQRLRKHIKEAFGCIKTTGGLAKTRHRGLERVGWMFSLTAAAYQPRPAVQNHRRGADMISASSPAHPQTRRGRTANPNPLHR